MTVLSKIMSWKFVFTHHDVNMNNFFIVSMIFVCLFLDNLMTIFCLQCLLITISNFLTICEIICSNLSWQLCVCVYWSCFNNKYDIYFITNFLVATFLCIYMFTHVLKFYEIIHWNLSLVNYVLCDIHVALHNLCFYVVW